MLVIDQVLDVEGDGVFMADGTTESEFGVEGR